MGIVLEDGSGVAIDWVTGRSYSSARRRLNVQSGQRKGGKCAAAPYPSVAVRDRGHCKGIAGSGWVREAGRGKTAHGWKGDRSGVRLKKPDGDEPVRSPKIISDRQYCHVGNTAKQCRLGLFQDSDFAGDLEDSKSTSGGTLCIFGSHTFVPISWMCKKQTAVSHSSTESEIISLDTRLRLDGYPALELWDLIVSVFGNVSRVSDRSGQPDNDVHKHHKSQKRINVMENIDSVPSNVQSSRQEALLYVFEDNEAVIKMITKGRSPTMRHVSKTHRVALDWLFDRINLDSKIQIKFIDTKNQLADILTEGNFHT